MWDRIHFFESMEKRKEGKRKNDGGWPQVDFVSAASMANFIKHARNELIRNAPKSNTKAERREVAGAAGAQELTHHLKELLGEDSTVLSTSIPNDLTSPSH